jgi:hypothetical protein
MEGARSGPGPGGVEALAARHFRALLVVGALFLPAVVFRGAASAPGSRIPCEVTTPDCLNGDPLLVTSLMARAWNRWDRGDFSLRDDRVFAPYPDAWAMGEPFLLPALVGYPFARLTGSAALGYNVPLYLAGAFAVLSAGALLSRLGGPGLPALLGAVLFAWGPARMNNLGVLSVLWAGLLPLVLAYGLDALDGRRHAIPLVAAAWLALGLGSLYGLLMGAVVGALLFPAVALPVPARRRRLAVLGLALVAATLPLLALYRPFFRLERDFDARVPRELMEGQAGDLLSLLHAGAFTGPVGTFLEAHGPSFPGGTSALFPTLAAFAALALLAAVRSRAAGTGPPERRLWPWALLALASLLFALGPVIRLGGRPLLAGPWTLLSPLPVFRSMRGLFRWDQWWDLGLAALFVVALARALPAFPGRARAALLAAAAGLVVLDVWPRPVPAASLPGPSPFQAELRALDPDAIVAVHPYRRETAARGTWEATLHGRRLLNSFQTFAPPVHRWLFARGAGAPLAESVALYRELGASAVDVDRDRLDAAGRAALDGLVNSPHGDAPIRVVTEGSRVLLLFEPREPVLVDPLAVDGLVFRSGVAALPGPPGRVAFRLRAASWPVLLRAPEARTPARLTWELFGVGRLRARIEPVPPPGREVVLSDTGRVAGRTE